MSMIQIDSRIWSSLYELRRYRLFPCLRSLDLVFHHASVPGSLDDYAYLLQTISPTLWTVVLSNIRAHHQDIVTTFISQLLQMKPQSLVNLSVEGHANFLNILPQSILTTLEIDTSAMGSSPKDILAIISRINTLRNLSIVTYAISELDNVSSDLFLGDATFWGRLQRLSVEGSLAQVSKLLGALESMDMLETLSLNISKPTWDQSEAQVRFFSNAAKHAPSVSTLFLRMNNSIRLYVLEHALVAWKSLSRLDIYVMCLQVGESLADSHYTWPFKEWSALENLSFWVNAWRTPTKLLDMVHTPLDLPEIASYSPALKNLVIQFMFPLAENTLVKMQSALDAAAANICSYEGAETPITFPRHGLNELGIGIWIPVHDPRWASPELARQYGAVLMPYLKLVFPMLAVDGVTLCVRPRTDDDRYEEDWLRSLSQMMGAPINPQNFI